MQVFDVFAFNIRGRREIMKASGPGWRFVLFYGFGFGSGTKILCIFSARVKKCDVPHGGN